jgi:hypothetical protein
LKVDSQSQYEKLKFYLYAAHLDKLIISTPLVTDQFAEVVQQEKSKLINVSINMLINLIGLTALVIYLARLYCINNRKRIAVKRMNGFGFIEIYDEYLVIQFAADIVLLLLQIFLIKTNIVLFIVFVVIETLLFAIQTKHCEHNHILDVMKEGC